VTYAVSKVSAPPPLAVQELVQNIRLPAGASIRHEYTTHSPSV
jgi:hypothetical protein